MMKYDAAGLGRQMLGSWAMGGSAIAALLFWGSGSIGGAAIGGSAIAQTVTADGTVGTTVTGSGPFTITGGTIQGGNLFHSFMEFSPSTATTEFSVGGSIERIFSRVTGSNASNIDGILRVTGGINPDFFLINPNGIVFGPNAQLDMSGSFIGSTASSVVFPNNIEFAANDSTVAPLLTINRPIGLTLNANAPTIVADRSQLTLTPQNTLALLGGGVTLTNTEENRSGASLAVPQGRVELGGVLEDGTVQLTEVSDGWTFDYRNINSFGDILFDSVANITLNGDGGGNAVLQGRNITMEGHSYVLSVQFGAQDAGTLMLNATNTLNIEGFAGFSGVTVGASQGGEIIINAPTLAFSSGGSIVSSQSGTGKGYDITVNTTTLELLDRSNIRIDNWSSGQSGNLSITTDTINLQDGGRIVNSIHRSGDGGDITIRARTSIMADSSTNPFSISGIHAQANFQATGQMGTIDVETDSLSLSNGAQIFAGTFGAGHGGNIRIQANRATLSGVEPIEGIPASIGVTAAQSRNTTAVPSGRSGNITLDIGELELKNGGRITASTRGTSNAGTVLINSNSVRVAGKNSFGTTGRILSDSSNAGNAGLVMINTDTLTVEDEGTISVSGTGTGNSGNIEVNARTIYLNNNGNIEAESSTGAQGNILLNASDILLLRNQGLISTSATGNATGGNITINAPVIAGYENSDITANAVQGAGGKIDITTQGIFGLAFRDHLTWGNDITASSQFGVNGTITVNEFSLDPSSGLVALVAALSDASDQMDVTCSTTGNSEFIATGRGGISPAPEAQNGGMVGPWQDIRDLNMFLGTTVATPPTIAASIPTLQEATGFQRLSNGQIALVAEPGIGQNQSYHATCATGGTDAAS
ncbi:MAG: filamentous hemagglutinin N-terminal domain-containing protein [Spirulina sp. SIO3F2]|nr:filamentous hemagglutinin N-terminal domain-containing protein [Spirulina sp. SIO3F2]